MKNKEKFIEVFGFDISQMTIRGCGLPGPECIHAEDNVQCCDCIYDDFWEKEFVEKGGKER